MSNKGSFRKIDFGPVIDPLPVDWTAYTDRQQAKGMHLDAVNLKIRERVARRRAMRFRAVPLCRKAYYVTLTATDADLSDWPAQMIPSELTCLPREFWSLSRRRARAVVNADRAAGGAGTMYPVEYRRCLVCNRLMLGPEAHDYRRKQMRPKRDWQYPEGPACNMECKPKGRKAA